MMKNILENLLSGGDLRSISGAGKVAHLIQTQEEFNFLTEYLFSKNRLQVMRAADAIEKITKKQPNYLDKHKQKIIELCKTAEDKELKWHLAQLLPRLNTDEAEKKKIAKILKDWLMDKSESKIVRVNSLQSLHQISSDLHTLRTELKEISKKLANENIPSITARLRSLKYIS